MEIPGNTVLKLKMWNEGFILPFIPWEVSLTRLSLLFLVCSLKSCTLEMPVSTSDLIGPKSKFNIFLLATSQALLMGFVLSFATVFPHSP